MSIHGFTGDLIAPGDDRYDQARRVWNAEIDRYPALIARPYSTADVAAAVRHAGERGLPLSVPGGGHSTAGLAVADGALTLDLSGMKGIAVDPAVRTMRVTSASTAGTGQASSPWPSS